MSDANSIQPTTLVNDNLLFVTSNIVQSLIAQGSAGGVSSTNVADVINNVYSALSGAGTAETKVELEPAVSVRASVKPDYLVCLEDGKKLKMLKRYPMTNFNMTPEEYRAKWNLPSDYPMVAPNYAESRREIAKSIGLGQKKDGDEATTEATADVADEAPVAAQEVAPADVPVADAQVADATVDAASA